MREPDEIPSVNGDVKDYHIAEAIGGSDYLTTPSDDLRWHACADGSHIPAIPLPVVFFEVIAKRLSITDDFDKFLKNIPLPISVRRHFQGAENVGRLGAYINNLLEVFPGIIDRAGYLLDQDALDHDNFALDFDKDDLKNFYSRSIQRAMSKDVPVIGAALSKLEGWDAPEKHQVLQVSEVRHILNDISSTERLEGSNYCPLPPSLPEG